MRALFGMALLTAGGAAPVAAEGLTVKLPASVQIESFADPGPNDSGRCYAGAFARFPHIPKAVGYEVFVDDTSIHDLDMAYSGPPFPNDIYPYGNTDWSVPDGSHQVALSSYSTGAGCAQAILGVEGRWQIWKAHVSMSQRFDRRYKRPFTDCLRRDTRPRRLDAPVTLGQPGGLLAISRSGKQGHVTVTKEGPVLDWEQAVAPEWFSADGEPMLVKTDANAIARVTDGAGNGIIIGPRMTVRIQAGKPFEVVHQGRGSFDTIGVRQITKDVATPGCVIATQ